MRFLTVEKPHEDIEFMAWDEDSKRRFNFDGYELSELNKGKLVWRGETAFSLDSEED